MADVENEQAVLVPSMTHHNDIGRLMCAYRHGTEGGWPKRTELRPINTGQKSDYSAAALRPL